MKKEILLCPICGKPLAWVKNTLLCLKCDASIIADLNSPNTRQEEKDWVKRNRGSVK